MLLFSLRRRLQVLHHYLARVKRILALDEDINQCSNNGAFVLTVATEMFIRYLAEQALNVSKSERKPRRNIQYKDLANAVARVDNLEFLTDVIPKTTTFREFKEKKSKPTKVAASLSTGQTTLDGSRSLPSRPADVLNVGEDQDELEDPSQDGKLETNVAKHGRIKDSHDDEGGSHAHDEANAHSAASGDESEDESEDIEMG
ncbi:MAG: hypothetical protein Q9168_002191 [Polycauliona sp. 1 TL-2023]